MPSMDTNRQALIAINVALAALDAIPPETLVDGIAHEVTSMLIEGRHVLGAPDYPELPNIHNYPLAELMWFERNEAEQIADGRL